MSSLLNDFVGIISFFLKKIKPKVFIYITLFREKIEMRNILNGKSMRRNSKIPFSCYRLLIADSEAIESIGKEMLNELCRNEKYTRSIFLVIHPLEMEFIKVYPVERMTLNDFGAMIGGDYVVIIENKPDQLSEKELKEIITNYRLSK